MIRSRQKNRWKVLVVLAGICLVFMFPIPFLPLFGVPFDETSIRTLIIITAIVSIPFTLLALFMNGAFESGLALLPMTAAIMALMIGASSRVVSRLGVKRSLVAGLGLLAVAMLMFVATPSSKGSFMIHVLPASLVAAVGMSLAYIPALMSAVSHARKEESGLASGIVNTTYQIGSAIGLAIMVAIASAQTLSDQNSGVASIDALNNGFHLHS